LGIVTVVGLPSAVRSMGITLSPLWTEDALLFWSGVLIVVGLWFWRWRHARWGRFITTIEHESLHAIVAMLTLIPVREMKVREDGSGHVLFEPPGHWLLYLAPYFLPLLLLIEIALIRMLQLPKATESGVFGMVIGLSLLGHLRQIHPRQTDFKQAGIVFTLAFLPTAFLLCYSGVLTVMLGGHPRELLDILTLWAGQTWKDALWIWSGITPILT
jgi:hypothetical protein